ncbi:hemolymph lipopolysaccharide-binding protein-like [Periplaneta americana]|uniref:hemolymph lipopolysaccharide-binding protein-like n=1 Tax=Periplaneta americana TaxID=6978 RepID=UPI0037E7438E
MYIAVLCTLVWGTALTTASECSAISPESFQLSINGYRNKTGQWIAQVSMEQNEDMKPWAIDVSRTVKECSGSKSVLLTVTISEITGVYAEHPRSQSTVPLGKRCKDAASDTEKTTTDAPLRLQTDTAIRILQVPPLKRHLG